MSERANIEAIAAKAGSNSHILQLFAGEVEVVRAQGQPLLGQDRIVVLRFLLSASYKVGFGRLKLLLFETAKHYLPGRAVSSKEKRRFVRMSNWMSLRDKHAAALWDGSRSTVWTELAYVDAAKLRIFIDDYLAGRHEDGYAVWPVYAASRRPELFGL